MKKKLTLAALAFCLGLLWHGYNARAQAPRAVQRIADARAANGPPRAIRPAVRDNMAPTSASTGLAEADDSWNERSYARALAQYKAALAGQGDFDRDEVEFRIAVALGKTQQWDAALSAGQAYLAKTPWKARTLYWLGRLYTQLPHQAYKVGERLYRGTDYPKTASAVKPQLVYLGQEDVKTTLDYFERARVAADADGSAVAAAEAAAARTKTSHRLTPSEEIDLNFDLAAWLPQSEFNSYLESLEKPEPAVLDEVIDNGAPYNRNWSLPKKVLYLYNRIAILDTDDSHHQTALSLLAKGLFVRAYRQRLDGWARQYDKVSQRYVTRHYPFDRLNAIPLWEQLVRQYPGDPIADRTQILIGQSYQQENDLVKAQAAMQRVIELFPQSKWVNDARSAIAQIERHELSFDTMGAQKPGVITRLTVNSRNIKRIDFSAYPVKLEDVLTRPNILSGGTTTFTNFSATFGTIEQATRYFGPRVAAWTLQTTDKGDYQGVTETIDIPLKQIGAYVVVAQTQNLRSARLLVISDLAILKKVDRDSSFVYIADAVSGAPVPGAHAVIKENYNENSTSKTDYIQGISNANGFLDKKLVRGRNTYSGNIMAFAWVGNRYAITGESGGGWWGYGDNRDELKVYAYTDRPVYRPGQKVYFRQIMTARTKAGDLAPAKGLALRVRVTNPKGETIADQTLTSNEFGTVNGSFVLPAESPLGEYYLGAEASATAQNIAASGGNRFRVEEYKRPEFAVTVAAPVHAVRPGATVAAVVNARYYFGEPVPGASVKYTVRRSTWWAYYRFPTPFDWLYRYWGVGDYDSGRRNIGGEGSGVIVKEGTVKTDAQGNAEVTFAATADPATNKNNLAWWQRYSNPLYTIEAEVTDASRRTIEGQGSVKVADQQYFAFLEAKRGFFRAGDRVQLELVTQDANDKPLAAAGKMVVYKLLPGDKEEKTYEETVQVPQSGHLFWTWQADQAAQYRVAFEATDAWGNAVVGSTEVWVCGDGLDTGQFRLQGVTIVIDKQAYQEGETLHALLVADQPGTTVLFTQEASGQILKRDLVTIEGKNKEIDIAIDHGDVPNFVLAAAVVKNYEVYQAQQEVFVPPIKKLIKVEVSSDKETYKPGEVGSFVLSATDWAGKPARAELSLGLTDASLYYIQKDYAPDIRTFYYGERRGTSVMLDSSRSGMPQARTEDEQKFARYETHNWELPDDMGMLNLAPGSFGYGYYPMASFGSFNGRADMAMDMAAPRASYLGTSEKSYATGPSGPIGNETGGAAASPPPAPVAPEVRSNFAETAFWSPAVVTEGGKAQVEIKFPDSLTQWHATVRGLTTDASVGAAETDVHTKKNLLIRMQTPRFLVERDQVVLTANVHNYLPTARQVKVTLQYGDEIKLSAAGKALLASGHNFGAASGTITVKPGEEERVNWLVDVVKEGAVAIQMTAQTEGDSDGVKMELPVLVHGVQRFAAQSGLLYNGDAVTRATITINYPKARRFGSSMLNVQLNPSLAATMLDALPYLANYPYGCVEQTLSRFLPTVTAQKVLSDSGIDLAALRTRAAAYHAESKTLPLGERVKNTGYSYPKGMPNSRDLTEMASQLWYPGRGNNPLFDKAEMDKMTNEGLQRLYSMQRDDGGWGWWAGSSRSDEYMSAYVMYGLATARAAEVAVRGDVLQRGYGYLEKQLKDEDNLHVLTAIAYSLSLRGAMPNDLKAIVAGRLYTQRERLTAYSSSLLAMALWNIGEKDKARVLVRNLENTALVDAANGTAHWRMANQWWCWWNNDVETNAVALRAFLQIDSGNKLAPMMMKWLTLQSRGNHWKSTRATAESVYALADYVRVNKELDVDYKLTVSLNGKIKRIYQVNANNALYFDNRFTAGDLFLQDGANTLTIEKQGRGNLYWNAYSEYFSLEEPIKASGNEIAIKRRFYKLTRNPAVVAEQGDEQSPGVAAAAAPAGIGTQKRTLQRSSFAPVPHPQPGIPAEPEYLRTELKDGAQLKAGDLVEVELVIDAANDYSYLVFEDMKAAGMEPVDLRSGYGYGDGLSSNVELRDEKVAFFVDYLTQGTHVLRYRERAEVPGNFHALPTNGYAMYAPEVRAISDEERLGIRD